MAGGEGRRNDGKTIGDNDESTRLCGRREGGGDCDEQQVSPSDVHRATTVPLERRQEEGRKEQNRKYGHSLRSLASDSCTGCTALAPLSA